MQETLRKNGWLLGLGALVLVIGFIFGSAFAVSRTNFAQNFERGRHAPAVREGANTPGTPPQGAQPDAQYDGRGPEGRDFRGGPRGRHHGPSFGRGLFGILSTLAQLAIIVAAVAFVWPKARDWYTSRQPAVSPPVADSADLKSVHKGDSDSADADPPQTEG